MVAVKKHEMLIEYLLATQTGVLDKGRAGDIIPSGVNVEIIISGKYYRSNSFTPTDLADGDLTKDPTLVSRGVLCQGENHIWGAERELCQGDCRLWLWCDDLRCYRHGPWLGGWRHDHYRCDTLRTCQPQTRKCGHLKAKSAF